MKRRHIPLSEKQAEYVMEDHQDALKQKTQKYQPTVVYSSNKVTKDNIFETHLPLFFLTPLSLYF